METFNFDFADFYQQTTAFDRIMFLLRFATFAPSTHNTQPWLYTIEGESCAIFLDDSKKLPIGDPLTRDLYISLGCFVENLVQAARAYSAGAEVEPLDQSGRIRVRLSDLMAKAGQPDRPVLQAIVDRFNARGVFKSQPLPPEVISVLKQATKQEAITVHFVTDPVKIKRLGFLTAEGLKLAYHDPKFRREISGWIRNNFSRRPDGIPGYSLRLPTPLSIIMPRLMRHVDIGAKLAKLNQASLESAVLVMVYTAAASTPDAWLATGRLAERVMLQLNSQNIRTSIFVASIEMGDLFRQVQKILETDELPQFLLAAGYMDVKPWHTKRRPVTSGLVKA